MARRPWSATNTLWSSTKASGRSNITGATRILTKPSPMPSEVQSMRLTLRIEKADCLRFWFRDRIFCFDLSGLTARIRILHQDDLRAFKTSRTNSGGNTCH